MDIFNFLYSWGRADWTIPDPGAGQALPAGKTGIVNLVSAGAEARTLADPVRSGLLLMVQDWTHGGTVILSIANPVDESGDKVATFAAAGQWILLMSRKFGTGHRWALVSKSAALVISPTVEEEEATKRDDHSTRETVHEEPEEPAEEDEPHKRKGWGRHR